MDIDHHSGVIVHSLTRNFDCSNNGVSTKHNQFLLVDPQNPEFGPFKVSDMDRSKILVVSRDVVLKSVCARPIDETGQVIKAESGGNFVYCSGNHYRKAIGLYPIAVFDRL